MITVLSIILFVIFSSLGFLHFYWLLSGKWGLEKALPTKESGQNAMDERVSGILKDEFYLDQTFMNVAHAKKAAKNAIKLYNQIRLHLSLDFKTPNMVYENAA